jgi:hypothetical protein
MGNLNDVPSQQVQSDEYLGLYYRTANVGEQQQTTRNTDHAERWSVIRKIFGVHGKMKALLSCSMCVLFLYGACEIDLL